MTGRATAESTWPAEPEAARLYRAVRAACGSRDEFAERVDAGIDAALSFLAPDPGLARDLTVLGGDVPTFTAQRRWVVRFAELLRGAADPPGASPDPRFREPFLIDGIRFQIGRRVLAGETARLQELRPDLLRIVLTCYGDDRPAAESASAQATAECEARSK
jgi:hypothetical protein